ncbi:MAG: hypothetical protein COA79_23590 [Planctomycetota bacterium]|nr:MAG: hypothetical protein COA79_23590 [Planctomycetota bacterium]
MEYALKETKNSRINLLTEIKRHQPKLPNRQGKIASFLINQSEKAKSISLQELCSICETSEPVVFAFCKKLGFSGFRAFKTAFIEDLTAQKTQPSSPYDIPNVVIAESELFENNDPTVLLPFLAGLYQQSIKQTLESLNCDEFKAAVDLITKAKRIVLMGVGISGNVGFVLLQNFLRTGKPTTWVNDPNLFYTHLVSLEKNDVVIALSQSGHQVDTIEGIRFAKERNIKIVSISSDPDSEIAENANAFLMTGPGPEASNTTLSIGAQIALPILMVGDALAVSVNLQDVDGMLDRAQVTHDAIKKKFKLKKRNKK